MLGAELKAWIEQHKPLIGLDFDGTLAAIGPNPETIKLSPEAFGVLERLCSTHECAFVTGRMLSDLRPRAPFANAHYIGTHGAEICRRGVGKPWVYENEAWNLWRVSRFGDFKAWVESHGGTIEDKWRSFSVHFRRAPDQSWWSAEAGPALKEWFAGVGEVLDGAKVWNVSPLGAPNKGTAILRLCRDLGRDSIVFFGDEATDENVFRLTEIEVFGIKVGAGPSAARARVKGPDEVLAILKQLA